MRLRCLFVPTLLFLALPSAFVAPGDSLTFHVDAKSKLKKTFENKVKIASESMSITIDGNDAHGGVEGPKVEIDDNETIEVTDEYLAVEDGRATKLQRTFAKLAGDSVQTTSMPADMGGGDQEQKTEKGSPLDGKAVVFTWKDDAYTAAWAEGEKGDDDLLEKLEADMDLTGFLPSKPVSDGDTWDLEAKLFNKISSPGGRLHLDDKGEDRSEENAKIQDAIEKHIEGDAKATYKGTREVDGVKVGVIEITADLVSHGTVESDEHDNSIEYKITYSGEALWDLKAGHLRSLELRGNVKLSMDMKSEMEIEGESHEVHERIEFAGEIEHKVAVE